MTIRQPNLDDMHQIMQLNSKYLLTNLTENKKQNGFIRISYDKDDLQKIISNKEIFVAVFNDKIVGYYLVGRKSGKAALDYQKNKAISLFDTNGISFDKIGYGCQVCIDSDYRQNGLFGQLLTALTNSVKDKYTNLLCSVSDDNIVSMKSHLKSGWQVIDEIEAIKFFIYNTHKPTIE